MKYPISTFTGLEVNPLDLSIHDIRIEDIAHGLALCNRFAGQSRVPISVAQHSVLVSLLVSVDHLTALLHDASEAYLGDVTKWIKQSPEMEAYRISEQQAQGVILSAFNASLADWAHIDWADRMAVRYEFEVAFGRGQKVDSYGALTAGEYARIVSVAVGHPHLWRSVMSWQEAEAAFLQRFRDLTLR